MKFGFINVGTKQRFNSFISLLSQRGYYPYFAHDYCLGDDISSLNKFLTACDVVFVASDRMKFAEIFNISDMDSKTKYYEIGTVPYVFLDNTTNLNSIEGIIKEYYSKLNVRMSLYRIFLESGKTLNPSEIFDPSKSGVTDKYSMSLQKNGDLFDIIIRYRNDSRIANINKQILDNCFNYIYSTSFCPLNELIANLLKKNNVRLRLAESFTSGRLASSLTEISGASDYFLESLVAYSDESKRDRLSISPSVLEQRGAVSAEVAFEMARSLMRSGCDIAVSTTGNAGPTASNNGKIGKCYIAVAIPGKIEVNEYDFNGTREEITESGVRHAQFLLYRKLKMSYN